MAKKKRILSNREMLQLPGKRTDFAKKYEEMRKEFEANPEKLACAVEKLVGLPPPEGHPESLGAKNSVAYQRLMSLVAEQSKRNREPLPLYRPLPAAEQFHRSDAYFRLLIGSNRAGKTISAVKEFARAITGTDPYDKYPRRDGRAYVIGKSLKHIGDTIFTKLFKPGIMKIIQNELGEWETFCPWLPHHAERRSEARPCGPVIPRRLVAEWSFEKKATGEIDWLLMKSGWEIRFFAAKGNRPQGNDVDLVWLDEEIVDSVEGPWIPEMMARTVDRGGKIIWSAAPQSGYANLQEMQDLAERQAELYRAAPDIHKPPDIVQFDLKIEDNIFQQKENVERFARNLSDEERQIRFEGISAANTLRMYPEFSIRNHGYPIPSIPDHWTRYAYIDPGRVICAVLFIAVPPIDECPGKVETIIAYDELYIPDCHAAKFAMHMKAKIGDQVIQAFVGDRHGLRPTESGSGKRVEDQYSHELREIGCASRDTGHGFRYAQDDRRSGVLMVRKYLMDRPGLRPKFLIAVDPEDETSTRVPNLVAEMKKYRKKKVAGHISEDGEDRGYTHLCQCLRYACMDEPKWVKPAGVSSSVKLFGIIKEWKARINQRNGARAPFVMLGNG